MTLGDKEEELTFILDNKKEVKEFVLVELDRKGMCEYTLSLQNLNNNLSIATNSTNRI